MITKRRALKHVKDYKKILKKGNSAEREAKRIEQELDEEIMKMVPFLERGISVHIAVEYMLNPEVIEILKKKYEKKGKWKFRSGKVGAFYSIDLFL